MCETDKMSFSTSHLLAYLGLLAGGAVFYVSEVSYSLYYNPQTNIFRASLLSSTESGSTLWPSTQVLSSPRSQMATSSTTPGRVTDSSSSGACTKSTVPSFASAPTRSPSTPTRLSRRSTASAQTSERPSSTMPLSIPLPTPTTPATRRSTPASAVSCLRLSPRVP